MSDYLANLLARSFAPVPEIRPRIPSMFETKPVPVLLEGQGDFEVEPESQTTPPGSMLDAPSAFAEPLSRPKSVAHATAKGQDVSRSRPDTESAPEKTRSVAPKQRVDSGDDSAGPFSAVALTETPKQTVSLIKSAPSASVDPAGMPKRLADPKEPVQPGAVRNPAVIEYGPNFGLEALVPRSIRTRMPSDERAPGDYDDLEKPSNPETEKRPQPRMSVAGSPRFESSVRAFQSDREKRGLSIPVPSRREAIRSPPSSVPASAPDIHVTIGRLEVRAITPSVAVPRPTAKKDSGMSLETYLQRRAEGGRR